MADLPPLVTMLLSAGGATFLVTMVNSLVTLRAGARARERDIRQEALDNERLARADARFWESVAGRYAFQLTEKGLIPDPEDPVPPSARRERPRRR